MHTALETQLQASRGEHAGVLQNSEDARRDFGSKLKALRAGASLAEERIRAAEARFLLELDRERTAVAKLQNELERGRASAGEMAEWNRTEMMAITEQLGNYRQQAGELEGKLKLRALAMSLQLSGDARAEFDADLATVEAQQRSPRPRISIIKEELKSIRAVLENAAGSAVGTVLPTLLDRLKDLI